MILFYSDVRWWIGIHFAHTRENLPETTYVAKCVAFALFTYCRTESQGISASFPISINTAFVHAFFY